MKASFSILLQTRKMENISKKARLTNTIKAFFGPIVQGIE